MATTTVTPDHGTMVSEIDIAAPCERVFKALIDAEETRRRSPTLSAYEMDPRLGGKWHLEVNQPHDGQKFIRHDGEIIEFNPPRLLVYTWLANFHRDPKRASTVRWELTPTKAGTRVKMTHSGLASEVDASKAYAGGWPGVLAELKAFLEGTR